MPKQALLACALTAASPLTALSLAQSSGTSLITGVWRGTSVCVHTESPCRDEENIYRFSETPGKSGTYSGVAAQIVDGKEVATQTLEWTYDPETHSLQSDLPLGKVRLIVYGNRIEGTLRLKDNMLYRRIHLQRSN